jgi:phthiodiolone/phenolphthiodiolone dimycocerosates ketoreductase
MRRITVGWQDPCLHPLWLTRVNMRMARLMGASAIWVPDHFMSFTPPSIWRPEITAAARIIPAIDALLDPIPILALAAQRIGGVDVGTSVTDPIRRHPMSLAQSCVTLDHISKGRAVLGIGNGIRENTEPYGLPYERNVSRLEEALQIIRLLWRSSGKPVDYDGEFWKLRDAIFGLPLYRGRAPRIFVGAHFPRMLRLTGRYADGWLPGQKVTGEEYGKRLGVIRAAADAAGRSFDGFTAAHTMLVALGDSRERVIEQAMASRFTASITLGVPAEVWKAHGLAHPLGETHLGALDFVPTRVTEAQLDQAAATMTPALVETMIYAGGPREICDAVAPIADAGCRHFIIANIGVPFTGASAKGQWQLAQLMRRLRRL